MAKRRKAPPPEELAQLIQRIDSWRKGRPQLGPMPIEIWDSAVVMARLYGVCRIARAVGLDYKTLRGKAEKAMEQPGLVKPTFVQLPATVVPEPAASPAPGTMIEISAPNGSLLRIHLEAGRGMEAAGIVAAFLGSRG